MPTRNHSHSTTPTTITILLCGFKSRQRKRHAACHHSAVTSLLGKAIFSPKVTYGLKWTLVVAIVRLHHVYLQLYLGLYECAHSSTVRAHGKASIAGWMAKVVLRHMTISRSQFQVTSSALAKSHGFFPDARCGSVEILCFEPGLSNFCLGASGGGRLVVVQDIEDGVLERASSLSLLS